MFDAGTAAIHVTTAIQSAPLWIAELRSMSTAVLFCAAGIIGVGAYTMAAVDDSIWLLPTIQTALVILALAWLLAAWRLTRQLLLAVVYGSLASLLGLMIIFFWWVWTTNEVYKHANGLWWTLTVLASVELLCTLGGTIATASLLSCRYTYDGHNTTHSAIVKMTDREIVRGTADIEPSKLRIAAGAIAIHDAAPALPPPQKKNI